MSVKQQPYLLPDTVLTIYCLKGVVPDGPEYPDGCIGLWEEDGHSFLFFRQPEEAFIKELIADSSRLELLDRLSMTYREWQGGSIEPIKIGKFILNPPWLKKSPGEGEIVLTLDPGVVFGDGTHPTTLACMKGIEIACLGGKVESMLDLGTGTGLLALVAARSGCRRIVAVDNNLLAARTARRNVELNGLDDIIVVVNGSAEAFTSIATDLLVANIHHQVMLKIVRSAGFLNQKWFVLSGMQPQEADAISAILAQKPVHILKRWGNGSFWQTILGITDTDS